MKDIIETLQALQENPDDLSNLPTVIAQLEEYNASHTEQEEQYQERIIRLQEANRNLLGQIPIPGKEPDNSQDDDQVTFEDAQKELINAMNSVGGVYNE